MEILTLITVQAAVILIGASMSKVEYLEAPQSVHLGEERIKQSSEITTLTPFNTIQADDLSLSQMAMQAVAEAYAGKRDPDEVKKLVDMTEKVIKTRRNVLNLSFGAPRDAISTELMEAYDMEEIVFIPS